MSLVPTHIPKYYIYDVLYNENGEYIIITPMLTRIKHTKIFFMVNDNKKTKFQQILCIHKHIIVYILNYPIFYNTITLEINDEIIENVRVNTYNSYANKIIMSTLVKNEENYIKQWIEYHKILGVEGFIIYINEPNNTLESILQAYILNGIVTLIQWYYPYYLQESGISGQCTQQNHSIYTFKNSHLIGLLDIDEYINPQTEETQLATIFNDILYKKNIDYKDVGGFRLFSKRFTNQEHKPENKYNFLKVFNCGDIIFTSFEKIFVNPKSVLLFSVHKILMGKLHINVQPSDIFFNHYIFLNKKNRGREKSPNIDDSIMRCVKMIDAHTFM